jgi:hypothetical protein
MTLPQGAGTGSRRLSGRCAVCTFWRLGFRQSSFRHITRILQRAAPYAWTRPLVYCHAAVPLTFRRRVRHRIQRHLLSSLPAARAIQHCASWRSYNTARPHQGIAQRTPDGEGDGDHLTVADLDRERIYRKPVLGGLINEYSRAA